MLMMLLLISIFFILITPVYIVYRPPAFLIRHFQRRWPNVLFAVHTNSKLVALTIDDSPSEYTNEIAQVLKANGAQATFFVIGSQVSDSEHEEALSELVRDGNELGNHAMYDEPSRALNDVALAEQIALVEKKLSEAYSVAGVKGPPKYFRPGSGFFHKRMLSNLSKLDYRLVLGSVYPHDAQIPFWRANASHILSLVRPGAIIICHDRRKWTVPMLKRVLPELKRRNYRTVTLSELLNESLPP